MTISLETGFDFDVPEELTAHAPAEARGLARDGVRMVVGYQQPVVRIAQFQSSVTGRSPAGRSRTPCNFIRSEPSMHSPRMDFDPGLVNPS